jgi:thioesterase domain-containing protein
MSDDAAFRQSTEDFFYEQIPLTRAMGVKVASYSEGALVLRAPLAPNHNHLGTAFGGSLSVMATLAGYGLLWLELGDRSLHIVIRRSHIEYLRPVTGEIVARCSRPNPITFEAFRNRLKQKGKSRLELEVEIVEKDQVCVKFVGEFVALRD